MQSAAAKHVSIWKMAWGALSDGGPGDVAFAIIYACNAHCDFARGRLPAASRYSVTLAEACSRRRGYFR